MSLRRPAPPGARLTTHSSPLQWLSLCPLPVAPGLVLPSSMLESIYASQVMSFTRFTPFEFSHHWFLLASFQVAHIWWDFLISAMPILWPHSFLLKCLSEFNPWGSVSVSLVSFFGISSIHVALRSKALEWLQQLSPLLLYFSPISSAACILF